MTFPSIVPSPAPSNCDKLLKGSIRPDLESLILECGENTAYGIYFFFFIFLAVVVSNQKLGYEKGLPDSQVSDRRA